MERNEIAVVSETAVASITPAETIHKAQEISNALAPIIEQQKLYTIISGKKHVQVEGWTTMLAMLRIFPEVMFVRNLGRNGEVAYESRVVLKTLDGNVIGSAEHMCSSNEPGKSKWAEYAIKSMAQTRAVGKAARLSFSWIMSLAGYATTPAEEMDSVPEERSAPQQTNTKPPNIKTMLSEIRDWLFIMESADNNAMKEKLKSITMYTSKEGKPGWAELDGLDSIAERRPKWIESIHAKLSKDYDAFQRKPQ